MIAVINKIVPKIMVPVPIIAVLSRICWVSVKSWIVSIVKNKPIARKIQPGIPYNPGQPRLGYPARRSRGTRRKGTAPPPGDWWGARPRPLRLPDEPAPD